LNLLILLLFGALAIVGIYITYLLTDIFEFDEGDDKKLLWEYFCVLLYAVWATQLSRYIGRAAEYVVKLENHAEQSEEDDSRIGKVFFLSSVISYFGLFYHAYWEQDYGYLCLLMLFLQVFNQILINSWQAAKPYKVYP